MTETSAAPARTPWHLWVVGVLSVPWNGFGAYDYAMTQIGGEAYLRAAGMTDAQLGYFNAMPAWITAAWAIGTWGALAGSALLLLRSKWALPVFVASLAAFLASSVYTFAWSNGAEFAGEQGWIMYGVILAGCLFFVWYAWAMRKSGVLP